MIWPLCMLHLNTMIVKKGRVVWKKKEQFWSIYQSFTTNAFMEDHRSNEKEPMKFGQNSKQDQFPFAFSHLNSVTKIFAFQFILFIRADSQSQIFPNIFGKSESSLDHILSIASSEICLQTTTLSFFNIDFWWH